MHASVRERAIEGVGERLSKRVRGRVGGTRAPSRAHAHTHTHSQTRTHTQVTSALRADFNSGSREMESVRGLYYDAGRQGISQNNLREVSETVCE